MVLQLAIGTAVILLTTMIQVLLIGASISVLSRFGATLAKPPYILKAITALSCVVITLLLGITINTWIWAYVFIFLDIFNSLEPALYFSTVTFTSLGYGDITISTDWRLLASLAAVNGLFIFGLNTAFIVEFTSRLRIAQDHHQTNKTQ